MNELEIAAIPEGAALTVWVSTSAAGEGIGGVHAGALRIRVAAPRERGRANEAVVRMVSAALGGAEVNLVSGAKSRRKRLVVAGLAPAEVLRRLGLVP